MSEAERPPTALERIATAQKRRAANAEREAGLRAEQEALDVEAIADVEARLGFDRVRAIRLSTWRPGMGAPVLVAVRIPLGSEKLCQRFIEQINTAKEGSRARLAAQDALAVECWEYPPKASEGYAAALEVAPLILSHAALQIVKGAQGVAEDEGKD